MSTCDGFQHFKIRVKISGHQQRWSQPLPGAILIPPALLVVADLVGPSIFSVSLIFHGKYNPLKSFLKFSYT
jgi:hypothetical protein